MTRTIVMIHGMWGGGWYWENYARYFEARGYRCVRPTLRLHDMNPREAPDPRLGTTSLLDYAEDLEKGIRELKEIPILMGHSMGGLLAQMLGSRGLGKALVLLTPASPAGIMALKFSVIRSFSGMLMRWGFWREPGRQKFEEAVYSMLSLLPAEEQKKVFERFVYESGRAASEIGFWLFDRRNAAAVDESKVTCPVLVIGAAEDRITPVSVVRKVAEKYKGVATYKEFAGHAHWVVAEPGWEEIAGYVNDWLSHLQNLLDQ
jgi:pimeloyl-ACP methyl ester carboxylesterase